MGGRRGGGGLKEEKKSDSYVMVGGLTQERHRKQEKFFCRCIITALFQSHFNCLCIKAVENRVNQYNIGLNIRP